MARRHDHDKPFLDIEGDESRFSIPRRKWRELVFIGAMVLDGDDYIRVPSRPLPGFKVPDLFPEGVRFRVREEGPRVVVERID